MGRCKGEAGTDAPFPDRKGEEALPALAKANSRSIEARLEA
jgi:hypothetical protein